MSLVMEAKTAAMTDVELIRELWEAIGRVDDQSVGDDLYWLTGEIIERWSPDTELAAHERDYTFDPNREKEIDDHRRALERRARLRAVLSDFRSREERPPDA